MGTPRKSKTDEAPMLAYFVSYLHNKGPGWSTIHRSHPINDGKDLRAITRLLLDNAQKEDDGIEWVSLISIQRLPI